MTIEARVAKLESAQADIVAQLAKNTIVTEAIKVDTADLLDIFRGAKSGARFILVLGSLAKWGGAVAAGIVAIWYLVWSIIVGHPPGPK